MIRLLLFAHLKEQLQKEELLLPYQNITVKQLRDILKNDYSISASSSIMVAVNEEFAAEEDMIGDGDVVALIPPISGG